MDWFQMFAAAAPMVASMIGEAAAAGDEAKAEELRRKAMAEYNIELPPVRDFAEYALKSKAETAHNPAAQASRLDALKMLGERSREGYNAEDKAAINDALSDVNQRERGQRLAIEQNLDPNSGEMLAAKLSNQQAGAQAANKRGMDIAAGSRAQAMKALQMQGQLAGQMEDDEFQRGQAGDAIAQFNERNRSGQEGDRFNQQLALADRRARGITGESDISRENAGRTREMAGGIGLGAQKGLLAASAAQQQADADARKEEERKKWKDPWGNP